MLRITTLYASTFRILNMADTIRVRDKRFNWRIRRKRLMYCHVNGNDLELFSYDGRKGELKKFSLSSFCSKMPKNFLKAFVEVRDGHLLHEELIAGYDRDELQYEPEIYSRLDGRAHGLLKNLTPSKSGFEALENLDISL